MAPSYCTLPLIGWRGYSYSIALEAPTQGDFRLTQVGPVDVYVTEPDFSRLSGSEIGYLETLQQEGFVVKNPNANAKGPCGHHDIFDWVSPELTLIYIVRFCIKSHTKSPTYGIQPVSWCHRKRVGWCCGSNLAADEAAVIIGRLQNEGLLPECLEAQSCIWMITDELGNCYCTNPSCCSVSR